jgi:AcrR family transcriptional regulator
VPKVSKNYRDARRQEILSAARRVFVRNGFHAASMQDLFAAAQLSSGAVYRYFAGKDEVVLAIAEDSMAEVLATIRAVGSDNSSIGAALAAGVTQIHARNAENGLAGLGVQVWSEALRNPRVKVRFVEILTDLRGAVTALAERHQQDGSLPSPATAEALATLMISILTGYILQLAVLGDEAVTGVPEALLALWPEEPPRQSE